jgi:hypothetical protein
MDLIDINVSDTLIMHNFISSYLSAQMRAVVIQIFCGYPHFVQKQYLYTGYELIILVHHLQIISQFRIHSDKAALNIRNQLCYDFISLFLYFGTC